MTRVSVPLEEDLKREIVERPEEFLLDDSLSEGARFAALLKAGAAVRRAVKRDIVRQEIYPIFAEDAAHEESVTDLAEAAFQHGLI